MPRRSSTLLAALLRPSSSSGSADRSSRYRSSRKPPVAYTIARLPGRPGERERIPCLYKETRLWRARNRRSFGRTRKSPFVEYRSRRGNGGIISAGRRKRRNRNCASAKLLLVHSHGDCAVAAIAAKQERNDGKREAGTRREEDSWERRRGEGEAASTVALSM